jgi:HSP20 family protein
MALPTTVNRGIFNPNDPFQRDFETVLGRLFGGTANGTEAGPLAPYPVDVREDADHFYVEAELPGFKKEEIEITLENQRLTITAERHESVDEKKGELLLNERRFHRFSRSFKLPPTVNEQSVNAKLNEGVLSIVLTKREESKPRKITVS